MSSPGTIRRRIKPRAKENEDTEDGGVELTEVIHRVTLHDLAQPKVCRVFMQLYCKLSIMKSWKALLTGKRAMLSLGLFGSWPKLFIPTVLMGPLVGFVACTLLLTHPPPSLSLLLEEYDLPSLGSAEVEWRQMFSGETFN
jgi:hypothetical protein